MGSENAKVRVGIYIEKAILGIFLQEKQKIIFCRH